MCSVLPRLLSCSDARHLNVLSTLAVQVCSKVLQSAAHDPKLVMRAAELADALMLQVCGPKPALLSDYADFQEAAT